MSTLSNLRTFQSLHYRKPIFTKSLIATSNHSPINNCHNSNNILFTQQKRKFAEGEEIIHPKQYKNVFNKRVSRDGKRVFYSVYPFDYNEPWPFPPVYDQKSGQDLNRDDVWGDNGECPPCSITGKPKRALGHYPWLGRPIVPLDDNYRFIMDDQCGPYPFFRAGRYEANRTFYWQWILFTGIFAFGMWFMDFWWRGDGPHGTFAKQRDELFYREHMCHSHNTFGPVAISHYANPCAPIRRRRQGKDSWGINHPNILSYRFDQVFIPAAQEDMYADEEFNYFKLPGYNC